MENECSRVGRTDVGALKRYLVLYSLLYCVISESEDLIVETFILFAIIQLTNSCRYNCCCLAAVSCLESSVRFVRSSVYESTCVFGSVGVEMSRKHRLNQVGGNRIPATLRCVPGYYGGLAVVYCFDLSAREIIGKLVFYIIIDMRAE